VAIGSAAIDGKKGERLDHAALTAALHSVRFRHGAHLIAIPILGGASTVTHRFDGVLRIEGILLHLLAHVGVRGSDRGRERVTYAGERRACALFGERRAGGGFERNRDVTPIDIAHLPERRLEFQP
jgi:hypothetical protein